MNFLIDNDVVYKLVAFNLLEDAIEALGASGCKIFVLGTLKFHAKSNKRKKKYGEAAIERVLSFVDSQNQIEREVTNSDLISAMDLVRGLDAGEMQLLDHLLEDGEEGLLLTGDKRFITGLAESKDLLQSYFPAMEGRLICLEQILVCLLHHMPFKDVVEKIAPGLDADKSIKACFGAVEFAEKEKTLEGLFSYINDLKAKAGGLLMDTDSIQGQSQEVVSKDDESSDLPDDMEGVSLGMV